MLDMDGNAQLLYLGDSGELLEALCEATSTSQVLKFIPIVVTLKCTRKHRK